MVQSNNYTMNSQAIQCIAYQLNDVETGLENELLRTLLFIETMTEQRIMFRDLKIMASRHTVCQ